jgi:hypothetical protein
VSFRFPEVDRIRLDGRTAAIAGGNSGIGLAIARALPHLADGASLVLVTSTASTAGSPGMPDTPIFERLGMSRTEVEEPPESSFPFREGSGSSDPSPRASC